MRGSLALGENGFATQQLRAQGGTLDSYTAVV